MGTRIFASEQGSFEEEEGSCWSSPPVFVTDTIFF